MISFRFHLKKWHNKTPEPLWFRGFSNRYLFRFAMLVAGEGFEPLRANALRLLALLRCPVPATAVSPPCPHRPLRHDRTPFLRHRRRSCSVLRKPSGRRFDEFYNEKEAGHPYGCPASFWLRGKDSNLRPPGYEPDELPLLYPAMYAPFGVLLL